jgi:LysM repeat protein
VILIPNPDMPLPTATIVPVSLPPGTKLTYTVQAGDTLGGIAAKFNSTIEAIIKENKITDPNALFVGQQLVIPANLVTPTATRNPTSTPVTVTATKAP